MVGMKQLGCGDGEDEVCWSYDDDQRYFTSCMFGT